MNSYTVFMESADAFVVMVEDSFDRIEDVVHDYGMKRILQMEKQLESLDQDLSEFIDSGRKRDVCNQSEQQI